MNGQENNNFNGMGYNGQPMNNGMMNNNPNMMNEQQMMNNQGMMQQPYVQQPMNDMQYANETQYGQMQQKYNQSEMMTQGLPPMQSDGEFAGAVQPVINQEPVMQQTMMQEQQVIPQPIIGQPVNQYVSNPRTIKGFMATGAGKVVLMLLFLVLLILLLFLFGHKTLVCSREYDAGEFVAVITRETEYWFGNATSIRAIMEIDLEELDETEREQVIQSIEELAEENESENIKSKVISTKNKVKLTSKQKVSDDSKIGSLNDEKKAAIEEDFVCKIK